MNIKGIIIVTLLILVSSCETEASMVKIEKLTDYTEIQPTEYEPVSANNKMVEIQISSAKVAEAVFKSDTFDIEMNRENAIFEFNVNISKLKELGSEHEMANYFAESVIALLQFYNSQFKNDFKEIIKILKVKNFNDNHYAKLSSYDKAFADVEEDLFNEILVRQDSFARFFNLNIAD